jgi:hypothetical protein
MRQEPSIWKRISEDGSCESKRRFRGMAGPYFRAYKTLLFNILQSHINYKSSHTSSGNGCRQSER